MTDLRLVYDAENGQADLVFDGTSIVTDDGLETAVIISFFSERHAFSDDALPDDSGDRRGWWGDAVPPATAISGGVGDRIGSRLWLLSREKQMESVRVRASEYAREAREWVLDDGIARQSDISADWLYQGVLELIATFVRPPIADVDYRFALAWKAQAKWGGID